MSAACFECGSTGDIHQHHVVPESVGGTKTVPLCESCHGLVHSRDMTISALIRSSLAKKRAEGRRTSKDAPFGWDIGNDGDTLRRNEPEQRAIELIRDLRAGGFSLREIARHLDEHGVASRGTRWHKTSIERILRVLPN